MIRLEGVELGAGGTRVLDHVTLAVAGGEMVVLGGARGSGKSSLLAIAAGALRPAAGSVVLGERELGSLQRSSLPYVRRNIGYVPAEAPLVRDETVLENVRLALATRGCAPSEATAGATSALAALALTSLAERRVDTLSSPERRLTAIARALCGTPPLLVLDDPGAGLDLDDRARVVAALATAATAGAAVLCGTSDDTFALALCDRGARSLMLSQGRLTGAGPIISVLDGNGARAPRAWIGEARPAPRRLRADGGGRT
jgi:ABC-type ATPase involved in cell division